jgi:AcrR family transcriptional regulator
VAPTLRTVSDRKGDRTRQRLLRIAIRRFATDGYRRTSVSEIAREAGVTPATTYAYFAGKEGLFHAAVDADTAALMVEARPNGSGASVRARWMPWLPSLVAALVDHPLAARVLKGQEPEMLPRLLDLESVRSVREELTEELRQGQKTGEVRADVDPTALAWGLESVVMALLMAYLQAGRGQSIERAVGIVSVLDAALRAPDE